MTYPWEEEEEESADAFLPSVSVTLKAGSGYDAPWIVLRGPDVDDVRRNLWKLSESAREALENEDVLLGIALAGAEFSGKGAVAGLGQRQVTGVAQYATPAKAETPTAHAPQGYTNAAGEGSGARIQQAGPGIPQWAVGLEVPIGDKTGQPMVPKEGTSKKTGKYYAFWSDPRPWSVLQNVPKDQQDTVVNPPKQ